MDSVWRYLTETNIPDVDLLQALYKEAHCFADLPYWRSMHVFLTGPG